MGISNYGEDYYLDIMLDVSGNYLGVSTADPGDDESGLAEPVGNSYARVSLANTDWNAASGGSKTNSAAKSFPAATGSWGTITHLCIFDAETAGNVLWSGELTASKSIASGQTLRFDASSITVSLT